MNNQQIKEARLPIAIVVILALVQAFQLGADVQKHDLVSAIVNLVVCGIFLALAYYIIRDTINGSVGAMTKRVDSLEARVKGDLAQAIASVKVPQPKNREDRLVEQLLAIVHEITGGDRPPRTDEIEQVKRLFNEKTDHFAKIKVVKGGCEVEISNKPFAPAKRAAKKPELKKPGNAAGKVKVTDKKVVPKKPLNKVK